MQINNTTNSIYGDQILRMQAVLNNIITEIDLFRESIKALGFDDPIEHCHGRIKSEESMREKLRKKGLPETADSALNVVHDAIGIRIVCAFIDDVYKTKDYLVGLPDFQLIREKDYIKNVKDNGYRSYHLILRYRDMYYVEIQIRTISMDTWAALEHHLKYKKKITGNEQLIVNELKRLADELASTDLSMQTIKNMIYEV